MATLCASDCIHPGRLNRYSIATLDRYWNERRRTLTDSCVASVAHLNASPGSIGEGRTQLAIRRFIERPMDSAGLPEKTAENEPYRFGQVLALNAKKEGKREQHTFLTSDCVIDLVGC